LAKVLIENKVKFKSSGCSVARYRATFGMWRS
jgi:hypothetical protein